MNEDMDVDSTSNDVAQPPPSTFEKKIKLDKAEKLLAKAMATCRAEVQQNGNDPNYLPFARDFISGCKPNTKGAGQLSALLNDKSKGLSSDMSRDMLVSCLIPKEKQYIFEQKEIACYDKEMRRLKKPNAPPAGDTGTTTAEASPTLLDDVPMGAVDDTTTNPEQGVKNKISPPLTAKKSTARSNGDVFSENRAESTSSVGHPTDRAAERRFPCTARSSIPLHHTEDTAFLIVPPDAPHGLELTCQHPECSKLFRFCATCDKPAAKAMFDTRHSHAASLPNPARPPTVDNTDRSNGTRTKLHEFGSDGEQSRGGKMNGHRVYDEMLPATCQTVAVNTASAATAIRGATAPDSPSIGRKVPCKARPPLPPDHTGRTAFLVIPPKAPHGLELKCSHPGCNKLSRYCAICDNIASAPSFCSRHKHTEGDAPAAEGSHIRACEINEDSCEGHTKGSNEVDDDNSPSDALEELAKLSVESIGNGKNYRDWNYIECYMGPSLKNLLDSAKQEYRHNIRALIPQTPFNRIAYKRSAENARRKLETDPQYAEQVAERRRAIAGPSQTPSSQKRKVETSIETQKVQRIQKFPSPRSSTLRLNAIEEETIRLVEESKLARGSSGHFLADWGYVERYASESLRSTGKLRGKNKKAALLRGFNGVSSLKNVTEQRQREVRRGLVSGELGWLGKKDHYSYANPLRGSKLRRSSTIDAIQNAAFGSYDPTRVNQAERFNGESCGIESDVDGVPMSDEEEDSDEDFVEDTHKVGASQDSNFFANDDLTAIQQELAKLCAESSFLGDPDGKFHRKPKRNWQYIEMYASDPLKSLMRSKEVRSRGPKSAITTKCGREAFGKEEDRILDEIRQDDEYALKIRVQHSVIMRSGCREGKQTQSKQAKKRSTLEDDLRDDCANDRSAVPQSNSTPITPSPSRKRPASCVHRDVRQPTAHSLSSTAYQSSTSNAKGSFFLDEYEGEAMRLGELSKIYGTNVAARRRGFYDWDYIKEHASDRLKEEMKRRQVYDVSHGKIERMFPNCRQSYQKSLFQAKQKEVYKSVVAGRNLSSLSRQDASSARTRNSSYHGDEDFDKIKAGTRFSTNGDKGRLSSSSSRCKHSRGRKIPYVEVYEESSCTFAKSDLFDDQDDGTELSVFLKEVIHLGEKSTLVAVDDDEEDSYKSIPPEYDFDFIWRNKKRVIQEEIVEQDIEDCVDLMRYFTEECRGKGLQCLRKAEEARESLVPPPDIKEARLQCGDRVYAMYPDDELYYPGRVVRVYCGEDENNRSEDCFYQIKFDDGDEIEKIEEYYVLPEQDYKIWTERWVTDHDNYKDELKAKGIQSYVDRSGEATGWNGTRGWWETDLTGDVRYSSIVSAMRAYDDHYVRKNGALTREQDLNMPEEWIFASPVPSQSRETDKKKRYPIHNITDDDHSDMGGSTSSNELSVSFAAKSSPPTSVRARASVSSSIDSEDRSESTAGSTNTIHRLQIINELSEMKKAAAEDEDRWTRILNLMDASLPSESCAHKTIIESEKMMLETLCKAHNKAKEERLEQLLRLVDKAT